jgi:myosin heavy subunit
MWLWLFLILLPTCRLDFFLFFSRPGAQEEGGQGGGRKRAPLSRQGTNGSQSTLKKGGANKVTVMTQFKRELHDLVDLLDHSQRHYVRCIKPNDTSVPNLFLQTKVIQQLKSNGVMETIFLRKSGYATRLDTGT